MPASALLMSLGHRPVDLMASRGHDYRGIDRRSLLLLVGLPAQAHPHGRLADVGVHLVDFVEFQAGDVGPSDARVRGGEDLHFRAIRIGRAVLAELGDRLGIAPLVPLVTHGDVAKRVVDLHRLGLTAAKDSRAVVGVPSARQVGVERRKEGLAAAPRAEDQGDRRPLEVDRLEAFPGRLMAFADRLFGDLDPRVVANPSLEIVGRRGADVTEVVFDRRLGLGLGIHLLGHDRLHQGRDRPSTGRRGFASDQGRGWPSLGGCISTDGPVAVAAGPRSNSVGVLRTEFFDDRGDSRVG